MRPAFEMLGLIIFQQEKNLTFFMSSSTHNFASSIDNCHINLKMLICMCFKSKVETSTYITRNKCTGLYWITFFKLSGMVKATVATWG